MKGKVIKDHNHKMHSSLGDWRHCEYNKGSCNMSDGAQANGLAERFMATLANGLMHYVASNQHDWCEYLPFITFVYNEAEQKSVGESPFFLMYH